MKEHSHQLKTEWTDDCFFLCSSLHGQLLYSAILSYKSLTAGSTDHGPWRTHLGFWPPSVFTESTVINSIGKSSLTMDTPENYSTLHYIVAAISAIGSRDYSWEFWADVMLSTLELGSMKTYGIVALLLKNTSIFWIVDIASMWWEKEYESAWIEHESEEYKWACITALVI